MGVLAFAMSHVVLETHIEGGVQVGLAVISNLEAIAVCCGLAASESFLSCAVLCRQLWEQLCHPLGFARFSGAQRY